MLYMHLSLIIHKGSPWECDTVIPEIYACIKLCILVNFEGLKELHGIFMRLHNDAVFCSVVVNSGSLFITKGGVKVSCTCTSCRLWLL